MKPARFGLRAKVALVALVLAVIPVLGSMHLKQMERLLREGQEQALLATARAIATALHDRPELLELRAGAPARGDMELILKSLARAESRIWIVDRQQRLLALAGDLKKVSLHETSSLLRPITALLLERPTNDFDDALPESEIVAGPVAASALQGVPARRWRLSPDSRAVILSASHPVWDGEQFAPRLMLPLSLSYDHRVIDGALAARFTRHLCHVLEDVRRLVL